MKINLQTEHTISVLTTPADVRLFTKRGIGFEYEATVKQMLVVEAGHEPLPPDNKSGALTTRPRLPPSSTIN